MHDSQMSYKSACNTFTPQIKGSVYATCYITFLGVLQLSNCAITSQWNVVHLPIRIHSIVKPTM